MKNHTVCFKTKFLFFMLEFLLSSTHHISPSLSHYQSTSSDLLACFCPQELVELINSNRVLVVSGETGCGKTTQVTQFILDDYINRGMGSMCRVVCTQPRRISAISVCTPLDPQVWHLEIFIVVVYIEKGMFIGNFLHESFRFDGCFLQCS